MVFPEEAAMTTLLTLDNSGWYDRVTPAGVKLGPAYAEDGFVIREAFGDPYGLALKIVDLSALQPMASGAYLLAMTPQVTRADGGRFGLTQLDIDLHVDDLAGVRFTGFKADGSVIQFDALVAGVADSYQTIVLPSTFTDLVSLKVTIPDFALIDYRDNPGRGLISFDNLVLTEPNALYGSTAGDTLNGTAGSDDLFGYGGADTLNGGAGDDWLDGGVGDDLMIGGPGDDLYFVNTRGDHVVEAANGGVDTVRSGVTWVLGDHVENLELLYGGNADGFGNALDNRMLGNGGANVLRGLNGDDRLVGGAGADTLEGGSGADLLAGGAGLDSLRGGAGGDLFLFQRDELDGADVLAQVADFNRGQGDRLSVGGLFVSHFIGADPFTGDPGYGDEGASAGQFRYEAFAGGVRLLGDVDGDGSADWTIEILGAASLRAGDFLF
jgi:Ca2+-binding RTX toxin-like protein